MRDASVITSLVGPGGATNHSNAHSPGGANGASIAQIIADGALSTRFQPIVSLRDGLVIGYEALTRGPEGTALEYPKELFALAERANHVAVLERACWRTAICSIAKMLEAGAGPTCVFINILPDVIGDPAFLEHVLALLKPVSIAPRDVVVEITEGIRIEDYAAFNRQLEPYRSAGLRIAVDDAGSGHSGLQTIVELSPDFVKIDRSLVAGIDRHPARRSAVEALVSFTRRQSIGLVAEGIESTHELMEVRRLGVQYAQGYFIAQPARGLEAMRAEATEVFQIALRHGAGVRVGTGRSLSAGDVLTPTPTVLAGTETRSVAELFRTRRLDGIVVVQGVKPVGLVMRDRLFQLLSQAYGREIYLRRRIDLAMQLEPLVVDARMSLVELARRAIARSDDTRYDHVVVVRDEAYLGTIAVLRLLEAMTDLKVAWARMENPLTGLPGNPAIEEELATRLAEGRSVSALYVDLDRFKAFNDAYGFHQGDQAIQLVAEILSDTARTIGGPEPFVGHVGGDDFIMLVEPALADGVSTAIGEKFAGRVKALYPAGFADSLMSLTVASATEPGGPHAHSADFLHKLARAKADAKARARGLPFERRRAP